MAEKPRKPRPIEPLHRKGFTISVPVLDATDWEELVRRNREVPRSFAQMKWLSGRLFRPEVRRRRREMPRWILQPSQGLITHGIEECGESAYYAFFTGLANPALSPAQLEELEADVDADTTVFENSLETDHFILKWTNSNPDPAENIADPAIISETGEHLEAAWDSYVAVFGRTPYVPAGATKIDVLFHNIVGLGVASPPDGPIQFDAPSWVSTPGIRRPTSAHELFHKLQYAFGYRTVYQPTSPYKWFSEGSASWAEVFKWQRVSGDYKILDLFTNPDINLYDASYSACPFWVFFQSRQQSGALDNPMVAYLQKYETVGDEELALAQVVSEEWPPNNVHGQLAHFFALFSRERTWDAWKTGPSGSLYSDILGPAGNSIAPNLGIVDVPLGLGDSYAVAGTVSQLGSDYYRFALAPDTDGQTIAITIDGAAPGDFSYYLVWQKAGKFAQGVFPFSLTEDYSSSETVDLGFADGLVLIVSGRGNGGTYSLNAAIV